MTMQDERRWLASVLQASAGPTPTLPFARGARPARRARPLAIAVPLRQPAAARRRGECAATAAAAPLAV